jgi:hypothetical protein
MSGEITIRGDLPITRAMKPLGYNASEADRLYWRSICLGRIFRADGSRYRVVDVLRDELNRLLAVGKLEG